jgi:hypothetical protein
LLSPLPERVASAFLLRRLPTCKQMAPVMSESLVRLVFGEPAHDAGDPPRPRHARRLRRS